MNASDAGFLTAIASLHGVGPKRMRLILDAWEPREAWSHLRSGQVASSPLVAHGLGSQRETLATAWRSQAATLDPDELVRYQRANGISLLKSDDPAFPDPLRNDIEPPAMLWAVGDIHAPRAPHVAIVGTRRCSRYGHDVARRFGTELAEAGVGVVSGLALGIDAAAHAGALDTSETGAPPIAIVGTGLDVVYPARNRSIWRAVAERGVIYSESPPGARAEPWRFPARNRLIAALADLVVVVESTDRGGSMYTVDEAILRDTAVWAVPGPITSPASAGTNRLLADGATPALTTGEILETLGLADRPRVEPATAEPTDPDEIAILDVLAAGPATLAQLAHDLDTSFEQLTLTTAHLEASGKLVRSNGWYERRG